MQRRKGRKLRMDGYRLELALALTCDSRHPQISDAEDIYAPLLGTWVVDTRDILEDGSEIFGSGEWIFSRILDGRGVQDVWIAPGRWEREHAPRHPRERYGTSIRTFDPKSRHWQVTWLNPVSGAFNVLKARIEDGMIIQEGSNADGCQICWTFETITESQFHWTGKIRGEDGEWRMVCEFSGSRGR